MVEPLSGLARPLPGDSIVALVHERAAATPEALAVESPRERLGYRELVERSAGIAALLAEAGVGPGDRVALWACRSAWMAAAALAVMELRAAYVPIDPTYPEERVTAILAGASPAVLLRDGGDPSPLPPQGGAVPILDVTEARALARAPGREPARPDDVAYIIFTSGSTGAPKGVMVEQRSLVNYVAWCQHAMGPVGAGAPLFASMAFDHVITCLWVPLCTGTPVVLVPTLWDQAVLVAKRPERYTFLKITPSHVRFFERMGQPDYAALTYLLMFGGERLDPGLLDRLGERIRGIRLMNHYGPTEATVGCCFHEFDVASVRSLPSVPIGRPVWNSRAYVVDEQLRSVAPGQPGELVIAGRCVARGYLGRPDETALRWLDERELGGPAGERAYRTGDVVEQLPSGALVYLGRRDDQIKIAGHRIELGEVRRHALAVPGVEDAAFQVVPGDVEALEAFVVAQQPDPALPGRLQEALGRVLPAAAVPRSVQVVRALAFNAHGKLDLAATRAQPSVSAEPVVRPPTLHDEGFRDGGTYERGRPGYPSDAIALFAERLGLRPGRRVLDLGAGTGKLTRQLLAYGVEVVAVDPSESMRAQFERLVPGVPILAGSGEQIPAEPGSFDVVLVAQAFHWFDPARALAEISRVLRPGGGLGLVWNERDESVDWVRRLGEVMLWPERQPYRVGMDFRPVIELGGLFVDAERHRFRHRQTLDHAGLLERVSSTSYIVAMPAAERAALMADVERYVASLPELVELPYLTDLYVARPR